MSGTPDPKPVRDAPSPRKRLRARPRPKPRPDETEAPRAATARFRRVVIALDGGCVLRATGGCDGHLEVHHVVSQQRLRVRGLDRLAWDPANGVTLCYRHHRRHTAAVERIPLAVLPDRCLAFAALRGLGDVIDREYPAVPIASLGFDT